MSNELQTLAINGIGYADLVTASIIPAGTPAAQVQIFAAVCKETGLSATKKEIYLLCYGGKYFNIVSIGGFRALAEKTGLYAGKDEVMYDKQADGTYKTIADYPKGTFPKSATLTIYKNVGGVRCGWTATIATNEYMNGHMAKTMPFTMINKAVESHALRSAFASLHNFYNEDEIPAIQGNTEAAEGTKTVIEHKPIKEKPFLEIDTNTYNDYLKAARINKNGLSADDIITTIKKSFQLTDDMEAFFRSEIGTNSHAS